MTIGRSRRGIPLDVWLLADEALFSGEDTLSTRECVARAIMAERGRCIGIADAHTMSNSPERNDTAKTVGDAIAMHGVWPHFLSFMRDPRQHSVSYPKLAADRARVVERRHRDAWRRLNRKHATSDEERFTALLQMFDGKPPTLDEPAVNS